MIETLICSTLIGLSSVIGVAAPGTLPAPAAAMANDRKHPVIVHIVSRHQTSGVDVLASPRDRNASTELGIPALDALFRLISERYDLLIVDLPAAWFDWTGLILSVCDLAIVTTELKF